MGRGGACAKLLGGALKGRAEIVAQGRGAGGGVDEAAGHVGEAGHVRGGGPRTGRRQD